jgi:predicted O-methyltransferase YrrM
VQLVRPGGLICVDNVLWSGRVADPSDQSADTNAIRALNERVHADGRVTAVTLPIADGMTIARLR